MAKIGYARVSSADQNLDRQLKQLDNVEKIFQESISGASRERPQLIAMLDYIRDADIVVVTELERLGRNNKELTEVMDEIKSKGATLEVLNLPTLRGIEDANLRRLLNNLILELYKYQAQAERERIKERQAQGIAIAKVQGKYKGRKPLFSANDSRLQHAFQFDDELWRAKTTEGMVILGKLSDDIFTLLRFNDEGGKLTHISESEALWLTLELAPEKMDCI
ncbi:MULTISPECIES: recombinase family protein [unclassified Streptococcus]|uniref:recombinase family protein n=1 Tax=unclassified Streptococcus TaxID=2608887 RepID=UPI0030FCDB73